MKLSKYDEYLKNRISVECIHHGRAILVELVKVGKEWKSLSPRKIKFLGSIKNNPEIKLYNRPKKDINDTMNELWYSIKQENKQLTERK